jgi:hypothetical protein
MTNDDTIDGVAGVLARLERATNAHDVNALVACFAPDYRNDTPAHPKRSFTGREQFDVTRSHVTRPISVFAKSLPLKRSGSPAVRASA